MRKCYQQYQLFKLSPNVYSNKLTGLVERSWLMVEQSDGDVSVYSICEDGLSEGAKISMPEFARASAIDLDLVSNSAIVADTGGNISFFDLNVIRPPKPLQLK